MDYRRERLKAFRATVAFRLGPSLGEGLVWNARTTLPTLASDEPVRQLADRLGANIAAWLYDESSAVPLEACEGRWKPAEPCGNPHLSCAGILPQSLPMSEELVRAFVWDALCLSTA